MQTMPENSPASATTGLRSLGRAASNSIGSPRTATGCGSLATSEAATKRLLQAGRIANDRAAAALLAQGCGVSFVTVRWNEDNSPAEMIIPRTDTAPNWSKALQALSVLNSRTPERLANAWLTALAVRTAAPKGSDETDEMKLEVYCRDLQEYPPDVVKTVLEDLGNERTFFPAWAEIYARLRYETQWRRAALEAVTGAMQRQGLLT